MPLVPFLRGLLYEGRAVLSAEPEPSRGGNAQAVALLREAYAAYHLEVAGPPLEFAAGPALAAGQLLHHACWFLLSHDQPDVELERALRMPGPPRSPADHLSADLLLRFLPTVYERGRSHNPSDRLVDFLATVLRQWPLSGVLAGVEEGPSTRLDFGHPGLWLLYAERLAANEKIAWVPAGPGLEYVELVWRELGKDLTFLAGARQGAQGAGHD